ncbi:hypothetical protein LIER_05869 [Lithospermum erythrorhizon]|uniref:Uncharacterized protein n=1 Tax=Lithospermum erythrorhizon TaxID=34254 RepID=A0AAV3P683_LITER
MDTFALSALYMIKALNAQYVEIRREEMREISSEKTQPELEAAQVSLKEREEKLNSAKDALSAEQLKYQKLQEAKNTIKIEHVKRCRTLEAELEKLRSDQSSLAKDVEDSHSTRCEGIKKAKIAEARASKVETRLSQVYEEVAQRVAEFKDSEEGDLVVGKESAAVVEYFEGLSVVTPLIEAPGENIEFAGEGGEVAERVAAIVDDETII